MLRKAVTLEDFDRDLRAFNCMDRIPEIKVGKCFYSDIRFNTIGSDVVAFYSGALNRKVEKLEKEKEQLKQQIEKMMCCANCKHALQGEYDDFENCGNCHATECECEIKSPTKNSSGKYHDWDDKCDKWALAELIQED